MGLRRKYVVLQVTARRTEGAISYEDVKDQIRKRTERRPRRAAVPRPVCGGRRTSR